MIPHSTLKPQSRWLLKLHGSVTTPDDIVITERDYAKFHEWRAAFKGVVQAQLITGHMLFVGFGMSDDNMSQVLDTVASAVANDASKKEEKVGTVLWFPDASTESYAQKYPLEFVPLGEPLMTNEERARRCEILLDEVMRRAEKGIGHLLDARFDELPNAKPEARREFARFLTSFKKDHGDSYLYQELRKRLEPLGYVDSSGSDASSSQRTPRPAR